MRGTFIKFEVIEQRKPRGWDVPLENYVSEVDSSIIELLRPHLCEHCLDAGWMRWADFKSDSVYETYTPKGHTDFDVPAEYVHGRLVCARDHLVAEVENFRDAGR